jgi:hypothetical protein
VGRQFHGRPHQVVGRVCKPRVGEGSLGVSEDEAQKSEVGCLKMMKDLRLLHNIVFVSSNTAREDFFAPPSVFTRIIIVIFLQIQHSGNRRAAATDVKNKTKCEK